MPGVVQADLDRQAVRPARGGLADAGPGSGPEPVATGRSASAKAAHHGADADASAHPIRFDRLTKRFGTTLALSEVSFSVEPGEIVVLLGPSGSGKSTLLRHVDGLERPSAGTVTVLGQPVERLRGGALRGLRARIGMIFQRFELVGVLSVLENVLTGALARLRGPRLSVLSYPRPLRLEAMRQLDRVGLAEIAHQRADTLSGGQQQRVAIARALMQSPQILLADEPVASLDPESSADVMALLRRIAQRDRLTVLCSLHQVDLALGWADRVVGLRQGEVVLDRPVEGLSRAEAMSIYQRDRLWDSPAPDAAGVLGQNAGSGMGMASPPVALRVGSGGLARIAV